MRPTAYRRNARGPRDRQAFEAVRRHARWQAGGLQALASRGPTGPAPRLSDQQRHDLDKALRQGARAHGFDTDHWTLERITTVIQRLTGVADVTLLPEPD